jgi:DNA-directed RNA polymerase subunit M/transcription elongation factor TFIIS
METLTTKRASFIERANAKHANKFDYSLVEYVRMDVKVKIICREHGEFMQKPNDHLSSYGCTKCTKARLRASNISTKEYIIGRFKAVHGDTYDYSLVENSSNSEPVKIICKIHGIFTQTPGNHYNGKGCNRCGVIKTKNSKKYSQNEIIVTFLKVHGSAYDYSQVLYEDSRIPVKIICKQHGLFEQLPKLHKKGMGCSKCGYENMIKNRKVVYKGESRKLDNKLAIERFIDVHGDKFDYSQVQYISAKELVKIVCKLHGIFEQSPDAHLRGQGCAKCGESKGEIEITKMLMNIEMSFEREKRYNTCKNIRELPFDFYLPKYDALIEFDGKQHFESIEFFGGDAALKERQKNDEIKTNWAVANNKPLLRIRYDENIETKLMEFIYRLQLNIFLAECGL